MKVQVAIFLFTTFLLVSQAVPAAKYFGGDDDGDDDVTDEAERAEQNDAVDLSKITEEELKDFITDVQENLKRAVDEMGEVELVDGEHDLERRLLNYKLGKGWSAGLGGLSWDNRRGNVHFNIKPTFTGFKPSGFRAGLTFRF